MKKSFPIIRGTYLNVNLTGICESVLLCAVVPFFSCMSDLRTALPLLPGAHAV